MRRPRAKVVSIAAARRRRKSNRHADEDPDGIRAVVEAVFGPLDSVKLDKEAHAIPVLVAELKALCQRIGDAHGLEETEVAELAIELLDGRLTIEDAKCSCPSGG